MDISLAYREKGEGEPLIMLHGNGESGECFSELSDLLSAKYRVIAPDTRGHGNSPRGNAPFTIESFADDLAKFCDGIGVRCAVILGFSDGANIAMRFAIKYPNMVKALILVGGNLDASGVKPTAQLPIEIGYRVARFFSMFSERAGANAEMLGLMVKEPHIKPSELSCIRVPALVVAGTHDMIKKSHTELIAKNIHGARLLFLDGDHFLPYKEPVKMNIALCDFLASVGL